MDDDVSGFDADHAADSPTQAAPGGLVIPVLSRLDHDRSGGPLDRRRLRRTGTSPEATFRGFNEQGVRVDLTPGATTDH
jgi:hypothetical protein